MAHHQTVLLLDLLLSRVEGDPALELAASASGLLSLLSVQVSVQVVIRALGRLIELWLGN